MLLLCTLPTYFIFNGIFLERDRWIDRFYYRLRRSNMTNETKNTTFHIIRVRVSSDSRRSRTLPMNVAIGSAHCGCEWKSCKDWAWSKMCGKHGWIWSKAKHCIKVWYSDPRTCLGQSVHSRLLSSLVLKRHTSYHSECELSRMEGMVWMPNNKMSSNMYWYLWFPCSWKTWSYS